MRSNFPVYSAKTLIINSMDTWACCPADRKRLTGWPVSPDVTLNSLFMLWRAAFYLPAWGEKKEMSSDAPRRTACNSSISQPDTDDTVSVSAVSFIKTPSLCRLLFFFLTSFWPNWQQTKPLRDHWSLPRGPHTNYPAQSHGSETFFRALGQRLDGAVQGETSTDSYLFALYCSFSFL